MAITDAVKTLLLADSGVSALVSTMYDTVLPRQYGFPAVVYHQPNTTEGYTFSGANDTIETVVQYDCFGSSAPSARAVADAIKAALKPFVGTLSDGTKVQACYIQQDMTWQYVPNADVKGVTYRVTLQFRLVHSVSGS